MNFEEAMKKFDALSPQQRAEVMSVACQKRGHALQAVCISCTAEAVDKTMDEGVKLAGGINEQAIKLMDAGDNWKKRAEKAESQIELMRPLVEAAITWKNKERWPYLAQGGFLAHAVDAYEKGSGK